MLAQLLLMTSHASLFTTVCPVSGCRKTLLPGTFTFQLLVGSTVDKIHTSVFDGVGAGHSSWEYREFESSGR